MKSNDSKKTTKPKQGAGYLAARAAEAEKQAETARKMARLAKSKFKDARKAFKQAKKFAKQARKEAKMAAKAVKKKSPSPRRKAAKKKPAAAKPGNSPSLRNAAVAASPRTVKRPKSTISPPTPVNGGSPPADASATGIAQA